MTSLLAPQFDVKGVALATDVDASVALICHGDPGRIRQIFINLVRNALKFTDRDAPAREMEEGQAAPSRRPENVLLAEDNAVNALLAIEQFKRLGFTLKVVADGRAAVEAVAGERFNLISWTVTCRSRTASRRHAAFERSCPSIGAYPDRGYDRRCAG